MSSRFLNYRAPAAMAAMLALLTSPAFAQQSDDADPEMRIQQLENQLRQLTGQNEELQYRNRQLEDRLRQLGGAARPAASLRRAQPNVAAASPAQPGSGSPGSRQVQQPAYDQQIAAPAPIVQEPPGAASRKAAAAAMPSIPARIPTRRVRRARSAAANCRSQAKRRSALPADAGQGEPLDLGSTTGVRAIRAAPCRRRAVPAPTAALTTLPPSATPKDEFDLGIGYMQRKDYALAEETMRNFAQKYPSRSAARGFAILARRKFLPAPEISRRRGILSRRDHQIR